MSERSSLILYKYNSQGEHQWTVPTQLDLPSRQSGYGVNHQLIVVNRAGDLHMLGILGGSEYSLAKYTTNGERSWAKHLASLSDRYAEPRLAVDAEDRFVVAAEADGAGSVTQYSSNGEHQWTSKFRNAPRAIAVNRDNQVFVSGAPAFLAKYEPSGALAWERADDANLLTMTCDASGNLAGALIENGDLKTIKYNSTGGQLWSQVLGWPGTKILGEVSANTDLMYVVGSSDGPIADGPQPDSLAMFLIKYNQNGVLQ